MSSPADGSPPNNAKGSGTQSNNGDGGDATAELDNPWQAFTSMGMGAMETFAANLARAAAASQSLATTATMEAKPSGEAIDPDPFRIAPDAAQVWGDVMSDPAKIAEAQMRLWQGYMELWSSAAGAATGQPTQSDLDPAKGDKRWSASEWSDNPMFDVIKKSYLLTARWLEDMVDSADSVDPETKKRVQFFTRQLADAFSPTNFPLTNPDVLRATVEEGGENLIRGLNNFAADLERGHGRLSISQTDFAKFKIGEGIAETPGSVVFQNDLFQLIHYAPAGEQTFSRPLLIFPPWINKFYILDLRPENSMVRWLLEQGHAVFLVSWVNPDRSHAETTFEEYMERAIYAAIEATLEHTGADKANVVGYCVGGTLLSCALAHMAKTGRDQVASATFFAAQTDFAEAGDLKIFITDSWLDEIERRIDDNGGVLDGQTMSDTFNMLRANDLVWSFYVNNYLLGKKPRSFDLLYWNSDQTRLPKALHLFYLRRFYRDNALAEEKLTLLGEQLSLGDIETPCFFQASKDDHIAPFPSVYRGARQFSGPVRFTLSGSGHIAGVINHPSAKKYQHWTNDTQPLPDTVEEWFEGATEHPGSWWTDWQAWLKKYAGRRKAALAPEDGALEVIEPAPGSYVRVKS